MRPEQRKRPSMKRLIVLVLGVVLDPITDFEDEDEQEDDPVR